MPEFAGDCWYWVPSSRLWRAASEAREAVPLPASLSGSWVADSPRYAGASLEISPTVIEVGTVEGTIDLQFISEVYRVEDDRPGSFDIHCKAADDTETVLRIVHDPDAGTLVFRNQPGVVWWRQPGRR